MEEAGDCRYDRPKGLLDHWWSYIVGCLQRDRIKCMDRRSEDTFFWL